MQQVGTYRSGANAAGWYSSGANAAGWYLL